MATTSPIPNVRDDDPEDVSWALSTAATSFARGDRIEALKWLRRAAEAASEAEKDERALELAKAIADLGTPSSAPPAVTPVAPATKPRLQQPKTRQVHSLATTKKMTQADTKLPPLKKAPSEEHTDVDVPAKRVASRDDAKVVKATEADAWPTEAMGPSDLDSLQESYGAERTRIATAPYEDQEEDAKAGPKFRASQAVRVVVWRDGDGELRIAPFGTSVSAVTIEALLVAPGPDVDLLAWLSPA